MGNFLNQISDTVTKPWREEVSFGQLFLSMVLFIILAFVVYDMLRILSSWVKSHASEV